MAFYTLPRPHSPGQRLLIESNAMDVVFAGRRWGKTHAGTQRILRNCFQKENSLNWWVGLSWRAASMKAAWRQLLKDHEGIIKKLKRDPREWRSLIDKELRFPNGSIIQMRTAENPESLAGDSVDGIIFDEFSMARESVWTEQLAPTIITTNGWCCFIGVPKGNNWATKLWNYARATEGWNKLHFTTLDNPMITQGAYERVRDAMPLLMQQQELLAEVIAGRGTVFSNVLECTGAKWQEEPSPRGIYVGGLDWAQENDYTVLTVWDVVNRQCVFYDRWNKIEYPEQLEKVRAYCDLWGFQRIISDNNAMGAPLIQQLQRDRIPVEPFDITNESKREIVDLLTLAMQNETVKIPLDEVMIDELESFEMNLTKLGKPQYSAPPGLHDDIVMSLCLGHWALSYKPSI